jgi:hypothetical protein
MSQRGNTTFKGMPPADVGARVTFEWLPGERLW